jgi:hypothetical protein
MSRQSVHDFPLQKTRILPPHKTTSIQQPATKFSEEPLGKQKKSGRDGFIVYMGNDIFGVKWRNWKVHFKEQDSVFAKLETYTMPRVYNLMNDPQERDNVLFPNTWVTKAALVQLDEHVASLKKHPPIPTGALDPYQPPK